MKVLRWAGRATEEMGHLFGLLDQVIPGSWQLASREAGGAVERGIEVETGETAVLEGALRGAR